MLLPLARRAEEDVRIFLRLPAASEAAGEDVGVLVRVLTAAELYEGVPPALARQGECYWALPQDRRWQTDAGWELWGDQILARALVEPALGAQELWQLGEDRDAAVRAYLELVRFFVAPSAPLDLPPQLAELVRRLCRRTGRLPHEILGVAADLFNFDARILVPEWFLQEGAAAAAPPLYTNDPRLMADGR